MAFPFLFLALSLVFGIRFSDLTSLSLGASVMGLAGALALSWIFYAFKKTNVCLYFLLASAFFLGSGIFTFSTIRFDRNALHRLTQTTYADFYGVLFRSPSPGLDRDYLYMRVDKMSYENKEVRLSGNLRISVPHSTEFPSRPDYLTGDHLKISAQIIPPREYRNFKEPFLRMYLKALLLHNVASTKSPLLVEKIKGGRKISTLRLMSKLRQKCLHLVERYFASGQGPGQLTPEGAVFETLILGGRGRLTPETTQALQTTGLFHLFAISGAHIGIISFLVFCLLKFLRVPVRVSYVLLIILLVFYSLLVEGRASVIRASIMSIAFLLGKLFWKDVHLINTISLSVFAILLFNPFQLFELGFQLTFAATFSILLFYPKILPLLPRLPLKIPETFALSLTAQMGVLPLIAVSFNRIIFSGLLLNLIGIPLVALIMAAGYLFLPVAFIASSLARPAAAAISFLINVFMSSTHLLDPLTFLSYRIPTPSTLVVCGYFLTLLLFLLPGRFKRYRAAVFSAFLVFFCLLIFYPFSSASKNLKVTFIDVGQGESVLIEFPGRKKMLVDGGGLPTGTFDIGESVVSPFLWSKGIRKIHYLVLTHAHPDHLYGLPAVARNFRIGEFWETFSPPDDVKYDELKKILGDIPKKRVFGGFTSREDGIEIKALAPKEESSLIAPVDNEKSLAMKITYGSTSFLLAADTGMKTEQEILAAGEDVKSDVLKSPHHGSKSSSSEAFLQAVAPQVIIISVGRGNRYGHPDPEILDRYHAGGVQLFRTDVHGAVEVSSDGKRISVRPAVVDN
jgi:competence protein ComEC